MSNLNRVALIMLKIQIDEEEMRRLYLEKLEEKIKEVETDLVFWDRQELLRRTRISWNKIQKEFFFDPRFSKHKIGSFHANLWGYNFNFHFNFLYLLSNYQCIFSSFIAAPTMPPILLKLEQAKSF